MHWKPSDKPTGSHSDRQRSLPTLAQVSPSQFTTRHARVPSPSLRIVSCTESPTLHRHSVRKPPPFSDGVAYSPPTIFGKPWKQSPTQNFRPHEKVPHHKKEDRHLSPSPSISVFHIRKERVHIIEKEHFPSCSFLLRKIIFPLTDFYPDSDDFIRIAVRIVFGKVLVVILR